MNDYIELGSAPRGEQCAQVGAPDYTERARLECAAYIEQLRRAHPKVCEKVRLKRQAFYYYQVVAIFRADDNEQAEAAFFLQGNAPEFWDAQAVEFLQEGGYFSDQDDDDDAYLQEKERNP